MRSEHASVAGGSGEAEFYLASASPRRRELLAAQGYRFAVIDASIAEVPEPGEPARDYVERMAAGKARAGRAALPAGERRPVLAADTEVVVDGCILGKPGTLRQAQEMLGLLSGRAHRVLSAVALDDGGSLAVVVTETVVHLRELESEEIRAYWRSGEPCDKAGGYAIQGLGAGFVAGIEGSYTGVVGLPLCETAALLRARGIVGWQRDMAGA
jgi:septum formation protein